MDNPTAEFKGECWNIKVTCHAFVQEGEEKYSSSKALSAQHSVLKKNEERKEKNLLMMGRSQVWQREELIFDMGEVNFAGGMKISRKF